jgi:hypothetical protein
MSQDPWLPDEGKTQLAAEDTLPQEHLHRRELRPPKSSRDWADMSCTHRFIKKRITASLGFRSAEGACRTIEGYEAMHAIRKGQVRWVAKGDPIAQPQFIHSILSVAA